MVNEIRKPHEFDLLSAGSLVYEEKMNIKIFTELSYVHKSNEIFMDGTRYLEDRILFKQYIISGLRDIE